MRQTVEAYSTTRTYFHGNTTFGENWTPSTVYKLKGTGTSNTSTVDTNQFTEWVKKHKGGVVDHSHTRIAQKRKADEEEVET